MLAQGSTPRLQLRAAAPLRLRSRVAARSRGAQGTPFAARAAAAQVVPAYKGAAVNVKKARPAHRER